MIQTDELLPKIDFVFLFLEISMEFGLDLLIFLTVKPDHQINVKFSEKKNLNSYS